MGKTQGLHWKWCKSGHNFFLLTCLGRALIELLTKKGCRLSDIHRSLQNVYRDNIIDRSNVLSLATLASGVISVNILQPSMDVKKPTFLLHQELNDGTQYLLAMEKKKKSYYGEGLLYQHVKYERPM